MQTGLNTTVQTLGRITADVFLPHRPGVLRAGEDVPGLLVEGSRLWTALGEHDRAWLWARLARGRGGAEAGEHWRQLSPQPTG